jgi:hypothetical protein
MHVFRAKRLVSVALLATTAIVTPAHAQSVDLPALRTLDENGVDLATGQFLLKFDEGSIGSGSSRRWPNALWIGRECRGKIQKQNEHPV